MESGILYIVATPIGNLEDMTLRAIRVLKEDVSFIYCEDTRQSKKLLVHYGISKPLTSLHAHSTENVINRAIDILEGGESIAYLTDCGTPGVSDPGSKLVSFARERGIKISPLPGPSALTALASVTGFPGKNIVFCGFLSKKPGKIRHELERLKGFEGTIIMYESPHRINKTLEAIADVFPSNRVLVGREITKMFEEFTMINTSELKEKKIEIKEKGEIAVAIFNEME